MHPTFVVCCDTSKIYLHRLKKERLVRKVGTRFLNCQAKKRGYLINLAMICLLPCQKRIDFKKIFKKFGEDGVSFALAMGFIV